MLTFLYSLNLKIGRDREISYFYYDSKHNFKCKIGSKMIMHLTVSKLFALEVVQKCQRCQLCVLWENSTGSVQNCIYLNCPSFEQRTNTCSLRDNRVHKCSDVSVFLINLNITWKEQTNKTRQLFLNPLSFSIHRTFLICLVFPSTATGKKAKWC